MRAVGGLSLIYEDRERDAHARARARAGARIVRRRSLARCAGRPARARFIRPSLLFGNLRTAAIHRCRSRPDALIRLYYISFDSDTPHDEALPADRSQRRGYPGTRSEARSNGLHSPSRSRGKLFVRTTTARARYRLSDTNSMYFFIPHLFIYLYLLLWTIHPEKLSKRRPPAYKYFFGSNKHFY